MKAENYRRMEGIEKPAERARSMGRSISRSVSRASWSMEEMFASRNHSRRSSSHVDEEEEALKWAAIKKLPTYDRLRTSIFKPALENQHGNNNGFVHREVIDVRKLDINDRQRFIDRIFKVAEEDNEKFLKKFRDRIDK